MKEKLEQIFNKHHYGFGEYNKDEIIKELSVLYNVVGQSEQFICQDCEKPSKEYRDQLCEPCHKWHTGS